MISKGLFTVELEEVRFDVYFNVETCKDGEKVFELTSIETVSDAVNLMPFLDSRIIENLEQLAIRKYVANANEGRDDD